MNGEGMTAVPLDRLCAAAACPKEATVRVLFPASKEHVLFCDEHKPVEAKHE